MTASFENLIKESTKELVELAKKTCWNKLSCNYFYVLSEISEPDEENIANQNKENNAKRHNPKTLEQVAPELEKIYPNIYDLTFYVLHAQKNRTIIELECYPKSTLNQEVFDHAPMIHFKIKIPPYRQNDTIPFDINWPLKGFNYHWNMFWAKFRWLLKLKTS